MESSVQKIEENNLAVRSSKFEFQTTKNDNQKNDELLCSLDANKYIVWFE